MFLLKSPALHTPPLTRVMSVIHSGESRPCAGLCSETSCFSLHDSFSSIGFVIFSIKALRKSIFSTPVMMSLLNYKRSDWLNLGLIFHADLLFMDKVLLFLIN